MSLNLSLLMCLILSGACLILNRPFLEATKQKAAVKAMWLKLAASLCFMLIPLLTIFTDGVGYSDFWLYVTLGLFFGMLGDFLLAFRHIYKKYYELFFAVGAVSFILEHILFIFYFVTTNQQIVPVGALCFIISFATATFVLAKTGVNGGKLQIGVYVYIAIVSLMCSAAISTAINCFSIGALMFAFGGIAFVASDTAICVYNFSQNKDFKIMILLHYLYYPAQILIALSVMFV